MFPSFMYLRHPKKYNFAFINKIKNQIIAMFNKLGKIQQQSAAAMKFNLNTDDVAGTAAQDSFTSLPSDIRLEIIKDFGINQINNIKTVSKTWYKLCFDQHLTANKNSTQVIELQETIRANLNAIPDEIKKELFVCIKRNELRKSANFSFLHKQSVSENLLDLFMRRLDALIADTQFATYQKIYLLAQISTNICEDIIAEIYPLKLNAPQPSQLYIQQG